MGIGSVVGQAHHHGLSPGRDLCEGELTYGENHHPNCIECGGLGFAGAFALEVCCNFGKFEI